MAYENFAKTADDWNAWAATESRESQVAAWAGITEHLVNSGFFTPEQILFLNLLLKAGLR